MDTIVPPEEGQSIKAQVRINSLNSHGAPHIAAEGEIEVYPHPDDNRFPDEEDDYEADDLPDDHGDTYRYIIYQTAVPAGVDENPDDLFHDWVCQHGDVRFIENAVTNGDGPNPGLDIAITQYTELSWPPEVEEELRDASTYM